MHRRILSALLLAVFCLAGCDSPQKTADTLRKEIAEFKASPDEQKQARIEAHFARLDQQIAEIRTKDATQADLLKRQYVSLQGEYQAARFANTIQNASKAIQGFGEALKKGVKEFGNSLKDADSSGQDE